MYKISVEGTLAIVHVFVFLPQKLFSMELKVPDVLFLLAEKQVRFRHHCTGTAQANYGPGSIRRAAE